MKKNLYIIFIGIILIIGILCLFFTCVNRSKVVPNNDNTTYGAYNINHYVDTIYGHVILITVCDKNSTNVSVSTLEIDNFDKIDND